MDPREDLMVLQDMISLLSRGILSSNSTLIDEHVVFNHDLTGLLFEINNLSFFAPIYFKT